MNRRDFMKGSTSILGASCLSRKVYAESLTKSQNEVLPRRALGKTGEKLSIIGFGGIVVRDATPEIASSVVARSIEKGVNYFDVAPSYGDAEEKLGPALKPYRSEVFLACKTTERSGEGAKRELHQSLKRLETDHFYLYQLHALTDVEADVKAALSKTGAIHTCIEAREQGLVHYLGFSAHTPEAALFAMREFDFDTILYPINFCCHFQSNFSQKVLDDAKKRDMGILALKSMAKQVWQNEQDKKKHPKCWYEPIEDPFFAEDALSWTLSQGVTAAVPPGDENLFKLALQIGPHIKPLVQDTTEKLQKIAQELQPIFS